MFNKTKVFEYKIVRVKNASVKTVLMLLKILKRLKRLRLILSKVQQTGALYIPFDVQLWMIFHQPKTEYLEHFVTETLCLALRQETLTC